MKIGDLVRGVWRGEEADQLGIVVQASEQEVSIHWPLDNCILAYAPQWWYMLEVLNESHCV